jgi:superfamily II DNA or RNA helicase
MLAIQPLRQERGAGFIVVDEIHNLGSPIRKFGNATFRLLHSDENT